MLTGVCIISLARRRNRYSYLVSIDRIKWNFDRIVNAIFILMIYKCNEHFEINSKNRTRWNGWCTWKFKTKRGLLHETFKAFFFIWTGTFAINSNRAQKEIPKIVTYSSVDLRHCNILIHICICIPVHTYIHTNMGKCFFFYENRSNYLEYVLWLVH